MAKKPLATPSTPKDALALAAKAGAKMFDIKFVDTFGVHAVGGTLGALLTGFLATAEVNSNLNINLKDIVGQTLWIEQLKAIGLTLLLAVVATTIIAYIVKFTIGLRPSEEVETVGLDLAEHGEEGYTGS